MALKYLLDTSVLTRLHHLEVRNAVRALAVAGEVGRSTVSDLEVGYSARTHDEWQASKDALDVMTQVDITHSHFRRALQVQRLLAQNSKRGRKIPDLLVAAVAEDLDVTLLHYDEDFDQIAEITGQNAAWVVPRGSVS